MSEPITACILIIGNEILSGRTKDVNLGYLSEELTKLGITVREARVIPDIAKTIVETVKYASGTFDYVFTTGGIGPTHDDITSECVARALGRDLIQNPEAVAILEDHYEEGQLNAARLRMANTPKGAILIENPISKAPGYQIDNVFIMAGVPRIAKAMFENLKDRLEGGEPVQSLTISTNLGEGIVAAKLGKIQQDHSDLEIGSYPYFRNGKAGVSLVIRGTNQRRIDACSVNIKEMIASLDGNIILSS